MTAKQKSGAVRRKEPPEPATTMTADPWYSGFATALAEIWRLHRDGQMVRHILTSSGITIKHLETGGVDDLDLDAVRSACSARRSIEMTEPPLGATHDPRVRCIQLHCAATIDQATMTKRSKWFHGALGWLCPAHSP
jgi:hypothetical protein